METFNRLLLLYQDYGEIVFAVLTIFVVMGIIVLGYLFSFILRKLDDIYWAWKYRK